MYFLLELLHAKAATTCLGRKESRCAGGHVTVGAFGFYLEAAIGIEPMNKGFAVLAKLFAQVQPCFRVSIFIRVFIISSSRVIA